MEWGDLLRPVSLCYAEHNLPFVDGRKTGDAKRVPSVTSHEILGV